MKKLKNLFKRKKIIYAIGLMPGELIKTIEVRGMKYYRIAFTNRVKKPGTWPVTDVEASKVFGIRKLPSKFQKWFYGLFGRKARATFYTIKRKTR